MISKVLFLGSKRLGFEILKEMISINPDVLIGVITINDRADKRSVLDDFVSLAEQENLNLRIAENRRHAEKIIGEFKPDLCFVVGWYWIIGRDTLQKVPDGFIGIHNSLLPKYRGSSPLIWTMINGEPEAGFSVFSFAEGMDEGDIWAQGKVPIEMSDTIGNVLNKLEVETLRTLRTIYPDILERKITPQSQNHDEATYCSPRFEFDGVIDWTKPMREIYDFIRAQAEPYPGAFTYFEDEKLIIWKARLNDAKYFGTPGQVSRIDEKGVYVICGNNRSIILETVEWKGVKLPASEIIKSVKTRFLRIS